MIRFACPTCSSTFTVGLEKAGKSAKCPKCQTAFLIPDAPAEETSVSPPPPPVVVPPPPPPPVDDGTVEIVPCPKCANRSLVMKEDVNKDIECPNCQTVYKATRADAPPPPSTNSGTGKKSKLAEIGSGKKKEDDEDEEERPSKRKRRRDEDDDDDDRPARRRSSSRRRDEDDEDDEDDRPSKRRSSRRRDEDDDDDYEARPKRRGSRGGQSRDGKPVLVVIMAVLEFINAAGMITCGVVSIAAGSVVASFFAGASERLPSNSNASAGFMGIGAIGTGLCMGIGLICLLWGALNIFGGVGLLKMKRYGNIITWILSILSLMSGLLFGYVTIGGYSSMQAGTGTLYQLAFGVVGIIAMVKHNDEFE